MAKKNQKYRKQNERKKIPWLLVALGGGLLLLAAILFANRSGDGSGTPAISVDQQKIDYGYVNFGEDQVIRHPSHQYGRRNAAVQRAAIH